MPQFPTCASIKIRSANDAQVVLYACHIGRLKMTKIHLDSADLNALVSGNVYAWEEHSSSSDPLGSSIERFTKGKRWNASRLRDVRRHRRHPPISYRPRSSPSHHRTFSSTTKSISTRGNMTRRLCMLIDLHRRHHTPSSPSFLAAHQRIGILL